MITKTIKMHYCQFCRTGKRKKSQRRNIIERHETICFGNDNRTPMPGELTQTWQCGDFRCDNETGSYDWIEKPMAKWWPGEPGMIFTGSAWLPVEGFKAATMEGGDEWPRFGGTSLHEIKPWLRRLVVLGVEQESMPADTWTATADYRHYEEYGL